MKLPWCLVLLGALLLAAACAPHDPVGPPPHCPAPGQPVDGGLGGTGNTPDPACPPTSPPLGTEE